MAATMFGHLDLVWIGEGEGGGGRGRGEGDGGKDLFYFIFSPSIYLSILSILFPLPILFLNMKRSNS